jgi:hypothetical protein
MQYNVLTTVSYGKYRSNRIQYLAPLQNTYISGVASLTHLARAAAERRDAVGAGAGGRLGGALDDERGQAAVITCTAP